MNYLRVVFFIFLVIIIFIIIGLIIWFYYRETVRKAKQYERGLKMVSLRINLPPSSTDLTSESRDQRDLTDEILSQAQVMYSIIASTAKKGFKTRIGGQRHISFEIVSNNGIINYYVVVPLVLFDVIKQAISTAYPDARLEEVKNDNIFSEIGKMSGTSGGELSLREHYSQPILTYKDSQQDASRAILNALSAAKEGDGIAIQIMIRPADKSWVKNCEAEIKNIKSGKSKKIISFNNFSVGDLLEVLWKPPEVPDKKEIEKEEVSSSAQAKISAVEEKMRYPGFESLIRFVVSSNTSSKSQALLDNIVASFGMFNSQTSNGFKFDAASNIDKLTSAYIMRFFPQSNNSNILNSVELSSVFHLPTQKDIPTAKVKRQMSKQVDGPNDVMPEGLLLGYNEYRGVKKPIRLGDKDRRRHTYFIGQTGTGKSVLLENLAYQDMLSGKGFAFIDPHGDSAEKLMGMVPKERVDDVIYFNPGDLENPIGLNLFEFETDDQRDFLIQEGIQMLYKLYDPGHTGIVGPRFEHWFRNAAMTIMADPAGSTFIDIPQVFNDQAFADYKLQFVKDQTVLDFWNKEMAQTTESSKSDVLGWFASKFGAFLSNEMMRNIIGQTKSGFNIREIMDNNKILLVNLSKGKTGELNSMLLGMVFVMKFQVAAMSRADIPEDERKDFCLYVDEFQNFATDSFESILSEARKYRLNIIVANQFMAQLTDTIREAIIGNVGTVISGRIGITDAEILEKRFLPVFNAEDLSKLPNHQAITSVMINNAPSAPFSMNLIPPMSKPNPKLGDALKKLSYSKYGTPRQEVGEQIFKRLSAGDKFKPKNSSPGGQSKAGSPTPANDNFLDQWLAKRKQIKESGEPDISSPAPSDKPKSLESVSNGTQIEPKPANENQVNTNTKVNSELVTPIGTPSVKDVQTVQPNELKIDNSDASSNQELEIKLR